LQKAAKKLNPTTTTTTEHGLTTFAQKTKLVAFQGRDPVRSKFVIDNKIMEKVNSINYIGNLIFYEQEMDIDKLNTYSRTPLIRTLVIRIANYPDPLGSLGKKFIENSTKINCLEIIGIRIKYSTVLWLLELQIRRDRKV